MFVITDTQTHFSSKPIRGDTLKIFKFLQLAGRKPLTHNGHVLLLQNEIQTIEHPNSTRLTPYLYPLSIILNL